MNPCFTDFIPCLRELTEANELLRKRETMLEQLSLFRNVSQVGIDNFFKWDFRMSSGNAGDSVVIGIQNISKKFTFHSSYWSITISRPKGGPSVNYKLHRDFTPGSHESFLVSIEANDLLCSDDAKTASLTINLNATFATTWSDVSFSKHMLIGLVEVDALHLLKPGRNSPAFAIDSFRKVQLPTKSVRITKPPPITSFSVSLNFDCANAITEEIFNGAGLISAVSGHSTLSSEVQSEFSAYIRDDKINIQWIPSLERLTLKCADSRLLYKLKQGVFRRLLLMCDNKKFRVRLKADDVDHDHASVLYDLKMQLASIVASPKVDELELAQVYRDLQFLNESIIMFFL